MTTKKTSNKPPKHARKRGSSAPPADEMRSHYDFDYTKSRPNRFAERFSTETVAVVLDPDVATVFQSAESVNAFLRSAIAAMPSSEPRRKKRTA